MLKTISVDFEKSNVNKSLYKQETSEMRIEKETNNNVAGDNWFSLCCFLLRQLYTSPANIVNNSSAGFTSPAMLMSDRMLLKVIVLGDSGCVSFLLPIRVINQSELFHFILNHCSLFGDCYRFVVFLQGWEDIFDESVSLN